MTRSTNKLPSKNTTSLNLKSLKPERTSALKSQNLKPKNSKLKELLPSKKEDTKNPSTNSSPPKLKRLKLKPDVKLLERNGLPKRNKEPLKSVLSNKLKLSLLQNSTP